MTETDEERAWRWRSVYRYPRMQELPKSREMRLSSIERWLLQSTLADIAMGRVVEELVAQGGEVHQDMVTMPARTVAIDYAGIEYRIIDLGLGEPYWQSWGDEPELAFWGS